MSDQTPGRCLLDYAIISDPFPLYAATSNDTPTTTLHVVVSNGGGKTIHCREILFSLPFGELAQSLVRERSGKGNAADWTVDQVQQGVIITLPPGDYANFLARPTSGPVAVDQTGIVITIEGLRISRKPGTSRIEIREVATTDLGHWPDNPGFTTEQITKFPQPAIPPQAVNDFRADKPDVGAGDPVRLTWRGPDTVEYVMSYGSGAKPADGQSDTISRPPDPGKPTEFKWDGKVFRDTTFVLTYVIAATTHCLTTTVTARNPTLTGIHVDGPATVASLSSTTSISSGTLTVTGDSTLGPLIAKGTINATGQSITAGTVTAATLIAQESGNQTRVTANEISTTTLAARAVTVTEQDGLANSGKVTAKAASIGGLDIPAGIQQFKVGGPQSRNAKTTYTAESDGIICGIIWSPDQGVSDEAWVHVKIGDDERAVVSAYGYRNVKHNFFSLPVAKGSQYRPDHGLPSGCTSRFFWIPLA